MSTGVKPAYLSEFDEKLMFSLKDSSLIPQDFRNYLPNPDTPWYVSAKVFERLKAEPAGQMHYRKTILTQGDQVGSGILAYYNKSKPTNRHIKTMYYVHNSDLTRGFEGGIAGMEKEAMSPFFQPSWRQEDQVPLRTRVIKRWERDANIFSPFEIPREGRNVDKYTKTKLFPLWHGTNKKVCESICQTGFTYFGKHQFSQGGKDSLSTDIGYFGSGIYFSDSAQYAADIYSEEGYLVLAWVIMREPFPGVADRPYPGKPKDMQLLEGHGAYKNYNAHYIPVISVDPKNSKCSVYYPCTEDQVPAWSEFVVFQKFQALPQFVIELGVDLVMNPSLSVNDASGPQGITASKSDDLSAQDEPVDMETWPELLQAAHKGETDRVRALLESGAKVDETNQKGSTALMVAADKKTAEVLLMHKANVNHASEAGATSLMLAAQEGRTEIVLLLLEWKADIGLVTKTGSKALMFAANRAVVEAILNRGANIADVQHASNKGITVLMNASAKGLLDIVEVLIENKANVDTEDNEGVTALIKAAAFGHKKVVKFLIQNGAKVSHFTKDDHTALMCAALNGHTETITVLHENGASINQTNINGITALMFAAVRGMTKAGETLIASKASIHGFNTEETRNTLMFAAEVGSDEFIELLLGAKAEIDKPNKLKHTALMIAAVRGKSKALRTLLRSKANVNQKSSDGYTAIHWASLGGHQECVEFLMQRGASVDELAGDEGSSTPLMLAALNNHSLVVEFLLKKGALIDKVNKAGVTALTYAASKGAKLATLTLLESGANTEITSKVSGLTAQQLALREKHFEIAEVIVNFATDLMRACEKGDIAAVEACIKAGKNVNQANGHGWTALMFAASKGHKDAIDRLIQAKAAVNQSTKNGMTALMIAAEGGHVDVVTALIGGGAKIDQESKIGRTALIYAAAKGYYNIVSMLITKKADINHKDQKGWTGIAAADHFHHKEVVAVLKGAGAREDLSSFLSRLGKPY